MIIMVFFAGLNSTGGGVSSVTAANGSIVIGGTASNPTVALPYKVYTATLSQSGTDAPVATILENTLGEVPVWVRTSPGIYVLTTVAPIFTINKTWSPQNAGAFLNGNSLNSWYFEAVRTSATGLIIRSSDSAGTNADDLIGNVATDFFFFQIFIYT